VSAASALSNLLKILFLLLLILVIIFGGLFWFDRLIPEFDMKRFTGPLSQYLPGFLQRGEMAEEDPLLLEREMLGKEQQILEAEARDLQLLQDELENRENLLNEREAKLSEEAKRLEDQEKVLSEEKRQYDNYRGNVEKQAEYFVSMPPRKAVERLQAMEDLLVIDILREIDRRAEETGTQSIVPYFLSLMEPPEKAATIQRKMTKIYDAEDW
jgi:flagellar protein FlbB